MLEKGVKLPRSELEPISNQLSAVGLGPVGYCCHNNGTCDCKGYLDCATMLSTNACNDDEAIVCDDEGCECTEAGPTFCPFEDCCTE